MNYDWHTQRNTWPVPLTAVDVFPEEAWRTIAAEPLLLRQAADVLHDTSTLIEARYQVEAGLPTAWNYLHVLHTIVRTLQSLVDHDVPGSGLPSLIGNLVNAYEATPNRAVPVDGKRDYLNRCDAAVLALQQHARHIIGNRTVIPSRHRS